MTSFPNPEEGHTVVVFDLDGTLAEDTYPDSHVGKQIRAGVTMLCHYYDRGYSVIVYTARPSSHKPRIWEWLRVNGLYAKVYDVITDKPIAGLYVDDRAWRFEHE